MTDTRRATAEFVYEEQTCGYEKSTLTHDSHEQEAPTGNALSRFDQ